jgi:hypothetical protein
MNLKVLPNDTDSVIDLRNCPWDCPTVTDALLSSWMQPYVVTAWLFVTAVVALAGLYFLWMGIRRDR